MLPLLSTLVKGPFCHFQCDRNVFRPIAVLCLRVSHRGCHAWGSCTWGHHTLVVVPEGIANGVSCLGASHMRCLARGYLTLVIIPRGVAHGVSQSRASHLDCSAQKRLTLIVMLSALHMGCRTRGCSTLVVFLTGVVPRASHFGCCSKGVTPGGVAHGVSLPRHHTFFHLGKKIHFSTSNVIGMSFALLRCCTLQRHIVVVVPGGATHRMSCLGESYLGCLAWGVAVGDVAHLLVSHLGCRACGHLALIVMLGGTTHGVSRLGVLHLGCLA
ncbi:unnamed protein product [Ilex paraguariensis]|uniref:Uncharacterized protein n=1 Tax=Ilex paraguariensis TaxID=185542 RepID=A0ABC8SZ35_9AQUA